MLEYQEHCRSKLLLANLLLFLQTTNCELLEVFYLYLASSTKVKQNMNLSPCLSFQVFSPSYCKILPHCLLKLTCHSLNPAADVYLILPEGQQSLLSVTSIPEPRFAQNKAHSMTAKAK